MAGKFGESCKGNGEKLVGAQQRNQIEAAKSPPNFIQNLLALLWHQLTGTGDTLLTASFVLQII